MRVYGIAATIMALAMDAAVARTMDQRGEYVFEMPHCQLRRPEIVAPPSATAREAEAAARAFVAALDSGRWAEAAGYVDPREAAHERISRLTFVLEQFERRHDPATAHTYGFEAPVPDAVIEARLRRFSAEPLHAWRRANTVGEVLGLTAEQMMERELEVSAESYDGNGRPPVRSRFIFLEMVGARDEMALARYRQVEPNVESPPEWEVKELRLRRTGGRWTVLPGTELLARAGTFRIPGPPVFAH
jgi:hypothetical protein